MHRTIPVHAIEQSYHLKEVSIFFPSTYTYLLETYTYILYQNSKRRMPSFVKGTRGGCDIHLRRAFPACVKNKE